MGSAEPSPGAPAQGRSLTLEGGDYPCPVCWQGQLQPMVLVDAYGCNLCRQILSVNLDQQTVYLLDRPHALGWRWQGQRWQRQHHGPQVATLTLWLLGLMLVMLPATIVALGGYMFPPLEGTPGVNGPWVWAALTLTSHGLMVGWLLAEHHQPPSIGFFRSDWSASCPPDWSVQ